MGDEITTADVCLVMPCILRAISTFLLTHVIAMAYAADSEAKIGALIFITVAPPLTRMNMGGSAVSKANEDEVVAGVLRKLSDSDFIDHMEMTAQREHNATMQMLHYINEMDRRKLFLELGYSSVFDYCKRKLGYSPSAAGRRI